MKERTFYTINLDVRRIVFIVAILIGLMTYFFMLGNAMGKKSVAAKDNSAKDLAEAHHEENKTPEKSPLKSSPEENMVPAPPEEKVDGKESEVVDLKPSTDNAKAIPVPVSPVQEVKEDLTKKPVAVNPVQPLPAKTGQTPPVAVNPALPAKKALYPYPAKKVLPPAKTPIVLEEKNFYTIQLGAFSSQEQANKFKDNVITKNKFPRKICSLCFKAKRFFRCPSR
ncbi:MAG: SPOR domain-containing protein [Leptospiraceae bacterium]|nr:SPOR domain-containing protein [Leptospiraceae bacterium]